MPGADKGLAFLSPSDTLNDENGFLVKGAIIDGSRFTGAAHRGLNQRGGLILGDR